MAAPRDDFDLDEDLFDFDEILETVSGETEKVDLDELLQALEESEQPPGGAGGRGRADESEELIGAADAAHDGRGGAPPAAPAATAAPVLPGRLARVALTLLAGLALLNVVHLALSWERSRDLARAMADLEGRFLAAAGDLRQTLFQQSEAMERNRLPVVAPDSLGRDTLEHVVHQLDTGLFDEARRRLYALLAVADRYDPETAREIEASASYLLADGWRLQAERAAAEGGGE